MSQQLEYISSYFEGDLTAAEASEFEHTILNDPQFADDVAFYLAAVSVVKEANNNQKKERFRHLYNETKMGIASDEIADPSNVTATAIRDLENDSRHSPVVHVRRLWKYVAAAIVIGIVSTTVYIVASGPSPSQMADKYISEELANLGALMGTGDSVDIGKRLNDAGNFAGALHIFEEIISREPGHLQALEYAGITALELGSYEKALRYFGELASIESRISNPGKFYMALTLMKRNQPGDKHKAKEFLQSVIQNNLGHREEAQTWLRNW